VRLALVALLLLGSAALARADVDGDTFRSPEWHVELVVPREWELSAQTSYPGIIVSALHQEGGRMTLGVQTVSATETRETYTARNLATLKKIGYAPGTPAPHLTGALEVDTTSADLRKKIRQAYFVRGKTAYILTLSTPAARFQSDSRAFEDTLHSIVFSQPEPISK
jgi:hypothetical protein